MSTFDMPLLDDIRKSTPAAKAAILAELLRERVLEQQDGKPIAITDGSGERLGSFVTASRFKSTRKTPPDLTLERREELERRYENRDKAISPEEMLASLNLDAPAPSSES